MDISKLWLEPHRIDVGESSILNRSVEYEGVSVISSPIVRAFQGSTEVSYGQPNAIITSTVPSPTANILRLPEMRNFVGGRLYVIVMTAIEDGETLDRFFEIYCKKNSAKFGPN